MTDGTNISYLKRSLVFTLCDSFIAPRCTDDHCVITQSLFFKIVHLVWTTHCMHVAGKCLTHRNINNNAVTVNSSPLLLLNVWFGSSLSLPLSVFDACTDTQKEIHLLPFCSWISFSQSVLACLVFCHVGSCYVARCSLHEKYRKDKKTCLFAGYCEQFTVE